MGTVDVDVGAAAHVGHAGTAEYLAGRTLVGGLCLGGTCSRCTGVGRPCTYVAGVDGDVGVALYLTLVAAAIDIAANLDFDFVAIGATGVVTIGGLRYGKRQMADDE